MNYVLDSTGTITPVHRHSPATTAWLVADATVGVLAGPVRAGIGAAMALIRTLQPLADFAARPPLLAERYSLGPLMHQLADAGRAQRHAAMVVMLGYFRQLVPVAVTGILDQLDLTTLIRDRIDLNALIDQIDVDIPMARRSTGAPTAEAEVGQDLRIQSHETAEEVAAWVDRVFRQ